MLDIHQLVGGAIATMGNLAAWDQVQGMINATTDVEELQNVVEILTILAAGLAVEASAVYEEDAMRTIDRHIEVLFEESLDD